MDAVATRREVDPAFRADVLAGLAAPIPAVPARWLYDRRGSELFEEITRLPEYYLTRTERALLERWMPAWIGDLRPRALVELGAGSAVKTHTILDAMRATARVYVPVDVSADFLDATAERVGGAYPRLEVRAVAADFTAAFPLPALPGPVLHAFLGSTIGNFPPDEAVALLRATRERMGAPDRFLMGVDLRKDPARIEAAYNDAAGVTAEFNRNMLRVLNALTGADFAPEEFEHRAFYNRPEHRIEMHLVPARAQTVAVPGAGRWTLAAGESIRTEISCKHDRASVEAMFAAAGLRIERWEDDGLFAILLGAPA
ncbi:MAG: L-histidine N(alpha)-methyltransferase [Gemmatimonadetes bacterium]|nr:L-histidine N(alpha)-methyltransferase [Gemmatimonadota bacterium]